MAYIRVAAADEVPEGEVQGFEVAGKRICVARVQGEVYAFADNCSHRDFPLSNGQVDTDDCTITCEWHGAAFDIRTGEVQCLPATRGIPVYSCRVDGDDIVVDVG